MEIMLILECSEYCQKDVVIMGKKRKLNILVQFQKLLSGNICGTGMASAPKYEDGSFHTHSEIHSDLNSLSIKGLDAISVKSVDSGFEFSAGEFALFT
jgi:hypothetical protein